MRMWLGVPARLLCRNHLLGEHNEIHKFVGAVNLGRNLLGYYERRLLIPNLARYRHNEIAFEMEQRGYQHNSPLPDFWCSEAIEFTPELGWRNRSDLIARCKQCAPNLRPELTAEEIRCVALAGQA